MRNRVKELDKTKMNLWVCANKKSDQTFSYKKFMTNKISTKLIDYIIFSLIKDPIKVNYTSKINTTRIHIFVRLLSFLKKLYSLFVNRDHAPWKSFSSSYVDSYITLESILCLTQLIYCSSRSFQRIFFFVYRTGK